MRVFKIPRASATMREVVKVSTVKPGTYWETTKIVSAERSQLIRTLNTLIYSFNSSLQLFVNRLCTQNTLLWMQTEAFWL